MATLIEIWLKPGESLWGTRGDKVVFRSCDDEDFYCAALDGYFYVRGDKEEMYYPCGGKRFMHLHYIVGRDG